MFSKVNMISREKGISFAWVAKLLIIFTLATKTVSSHDREMHPSGQKMLSDLITSMYIRSHEVPIDSGLVDGLKDNIIGEYFTDPIFQKFLLAFEHFIYPRMILQHGQSCTPSYLEKYKSPFTHDFTDEALRYWVAAHIPDKHTGVVEIPQDIKYCDFRKSLVCNSTTLTCTCPPSTTLSNGDDPKITSKHCFVKAMQPCQLINLENSDRSLKSLVNVLSTILFSPDRPPSCIPGTSCRYKPPHLNTPRCWCHNTHYPKECIITRLGWYSGPLPASTHPPLNLQNLITLLENSTSNYSTIYIGRDEKTEDRRETEVNKRYLTNATDTLISNYRKLQSLDHSPPHFHEKSVKKLKTLLEKNDKCINNLSEDLTSCQLQTINPTIECESEKECNYKKMCYCTESKTFDIRHEEMHRKYGTECLLGAYDEDSLCSYPFTCYNWDLSQSSKGICSCPLGFGGSQSYCIHKENFANLEYHNQMVIFITPATIPLRGAKLKEYQEEVVSLELNILVRQFTLYNVSNVKNLEFECDLLLNSRWMEIYQYYSSLKATPSGKQPREEKLTAMLNTFKTFSKDIKSDTEFRKLCFIQAYFYCDDEGHTGRHVGKCKQDPTLPFFAGIHNLTEKLSNILEYYNKSTSILDKLPPKLKISGSACTATPYGKDVTGSVRNPGKDDLCESPSVCVEDFETADFKRMWKVYRKNGTLETLYEDEEPPLERDEIANPFCELVHRPDKICRCSENKHGEQCDLNRTEVKRKSWTSCEFQYLLDKLLILEVLIAESSDLNIGEDCDPLAEQIVTQLRRGWLGDESHPDLYYHHFQAQNVIKMVPSYCDRRKLLSCNSITKKCQCIRGTSRRLHGNGVEDEQYCYPHKGDCDQDPANLLNLFPQEMREIWTHYGDPHLNIGVDSHTGCLENLCAFKNDEAKICRKDPTFSLFAESKPSKTISHNLSAGSGKIAHAVPAITLIFVLIRGILITQ